MALIPRTVITFPLDGSNREFNIPFEYLTRKFIQVTLVGADRKLLKLNVDYRFTSKTTITTNKPWGGGDGYVQIELRRYTSAIDRLVNFNDGSILRAFDLNVSQLQAVHIAEEGRDILTDTIGVDDNGYLDARGRKIVNLRDGVQDGDAVSVRQIKDYTNQATKLFEDSLRFLKPSHNIPLTRDDGSPLKIGDRYLNLSLPGIEFIYKASGWAANNLDGDVLATGNGSQLIGHTAGFEGAVPRPLGKRQDDWVSVKDFGAVGDGVTDDTNAIQRAFLSTNKTIYFPAGKYKITKTLYRVNGMVCGEGFQSRLVFFNINRQNGIEFAPQDPNVTTGASGLTFGVLGQNGGVACLTPKHSLNYHRFHQNWRWEYLNFTGETNPTPGTNNAFETTEGWECGIQQGDGFSCNMRAIYFRGNYRSDTAPTNQLHSVGIRLEAASALLTAYISELTFTNVWRGIEPGRKVFFNISRFDIAHSYNGIFGLSGESIYGESKVLNGNINSQGDGISFTDIGTREVSGVVVRRTRYGAKDAKHDWVGFRFTNANYVWLTNCQVSPDESQGAWDGTHYGVQFVKCGGAHVSGLMGNPGLDRLILVNDSVMVNIDHTFTFQNEATDIVYRFINNSRACRIGSITKVSSWKGIEYSEDSTIAPGAIQYDSRNFMPQARDPFMMLRRKASDPSEQNWAIRAGTNMLAIQLTDDKDTTNTNAIIITREGMAASKVEIRAATTVTARIIPNTDALRNLGAPDARWNNSYFAVAPTVTSDARAKEQDRPLDEAELAVARRLKGLLKVYKMRDAVALRADDARIHVGIYAQDVIEAFKAEGLDVDRYAILCHDSWEATEEIPAEVNEEGVEIMPMTPAKPAGDLYGVRYEQLLAFIISAI